MKKKILLIWDLDGAIGQINSTLPYNFEFKQLALELDNVRYALDKMDEFGVKSCFAITGFSAEEGVYPYVFPELIKEIHRRGHEIASHSWRHEWIPLFEQNQIKKSLQRSKLALEKSTGTVETVVGFVPPHNRPMSWLSHGAFSIGDRGLFPFFRMGDNGELMRLLRETGYKWIRISFQPMWEKWGRKKRASTGRIVMNQAMMILENHHTGFDESVTDYILTSSMATHTLSAHPLMLNFPNKVENKENFEKFLARIAKEGPDIQFVRPCDILLDWSNDKFSIGQ